MDAFKEFEKIIKDSSNIVVFTGAGISTESGIPDFRSAGGLFSSSRGTFNYPPEVMLSHSFFEEHTEVFFEYYKTRLIYRDAKPNDAHRALAKLENSGKLKAVVTQNIDGLHQMAGCSNVLELHGSVHRNYCLKCRTKYNLDYVTNSPGMVPVCTKCGGTVRPDVVLYEEQLDMNVFDKAISYISKADVLIVGGTSLVVYPAAGLVDYYRGSKLVLVNKAHTAYDSRASLVFHDSIGKVLSECTVDI